MESLVEFDLMKVAVEYQHEYFHKYSLIVHDAFPLVVDPIFIYQIDQNNISILPFVVR